MDLQWPQITYIAITGITLGVQLANHGKPRSGNHDFGASILATAILYVLLWQGGFFS